MKWISVEERLPKFDVRVVGIGTYNGKRTVPSILIRDEEGWFDARKKMMVEKPGVVTHWMPLPSPPQPAADAGRKEE